MVLKLLQDFGVKQKLQVILLLKNVKILILSSPTKYIHYITKDLNFDMKAKIFKRFRSGLTLNTANNTRCYTSSLKKQNHPSNSKIPKSQTSRLKSHCRLHLSSTYFLF